MKKEASLHLFKKESKKGCFFLDTLRKSEIIISFLKATHCLSALHRRNTINMALLTNSDFFGFQRKHERKNLLEQ